MLTSLLKLSRPLPPTPDKPTTNQAAIGQLTEAPATPAAIPPRLRGLSWALPAVLMLPLLTACETSVDVPEPEHTPGVALSLTLDNLPWDDSLRRQDFIGRRPFVSVSRRLYAQGQLQGRTDATVEVRDAAGTVVERYRPAAPVGGSFETGRYRSTLRYQFQPGQEYQVRVTVPGIETAESRLTLPATVPVQATATALGNTNGQDRARITVSFDDPGSTTDHYLAAARIVDGQGRPAGYLNVEDNGIGDVAGYRLSDPASTYSLYPFTDANLNGQRISFTQTISYSGAGMPGGGPLYLELTLSHLTRDLYLFFNSQVQYQNNNGNPFAEPTPLHSNVTPGFGIFGGSTDAVVRVPL